MYTVLTAAVENRVIDEVRRLCADDPMFRDMVDSVSDTFPYAEAAQRGVYVEDVSASHQALSPDNYVGTQLSHVYAAKVGVAPAAGQGPADQPRVTGHFVEWAREDPTWYLRREDEDVSSQVVEGGTSVFTVAHGDWVGPDGLPASTVFDVDVLVDGRRVVPRAVDPARRGVTVWPPPRPHSEVRVIYSRRRRPVAALHYLRVTSDATLSVKPLYVVRKAVLADPYAGEASFQLPDAGILPRTVRVHVAPPSAPLDYGVHYSLDHGTGVLTVLLPEQVPRRRLLVSYRREGPQVDGVAWSPGTSTTKLIPGALVAFGDHYEVGATAVVGLTEERLDVADVYGGRWDVSVNLTAYARSPQERQSLVDWLATCLQAVVKPRLDRDGLAFSGLSLGGKGRFTYVEGSNDEYYTQGISFTVQTDWEVHLPYPVRVEGFRAEPSLGAQQLAVSPTRSDSAAALLERYK